MRLIDADEVRKKAVPHTRGDFGGYNSEIRKWAVLVGDIDDAPTVDAVPVVRCKDCKHFAPCEEIDGVSWTGFCNYGDFHTDEDDFCSRGEGRDGE